jgi:pimeloyl-ACP methyl ester carboxylesterase
MSAISIGGDLIHYEVLGRGRPVILLHSWVGSWRYWIPTMQQLQVNYKVYAIDLYGYGDSVKNARKYSLEHQISLLEDFVSNLGIPKLALVGHGLGAMVAVEYARRHEDKVPRLLISGAPLFDPGDLDTRAKVIPEKATANPEPVQVNQPEATVMSVNSAMRAALADAAARRGVTPLAASNPTNTPAAAPPPDHTNNMLRKRLIEEKKANPQRLLDLCFKSTEPEYKKLQVDVTKADERAIEASMQVFDAGSMLDSLRLLSSPVVAVHGLQDDVIEPPGDKVWDYLTVDKGDTLQPVLLEGVRHFPMLEHDRFFRLLNDFLEAPDVSKLEIKERWTRRSH